MKILLVVLGLVAALSRADEREGIQNPTPAFPARIELVPTEAPRVNPPTREDLAATKEGGGGGNEVGGGGNGAEDLFVARGHTIVLAIRDFNRLHTEFPEAMISETDLRKFEDAVAKTRVVRWALRPVYRGVERDAGVFEDPERMGALSIAIHGPTFEAWNEKGVNYDEIVLHEYGLVARLPDQFYLVTAPVVAKLKYSGLLPSGDRSRLSRHSSLAIPPGLTSRPSTRVYFKTAGDAPPNNMGIFLGTRDSYVLGKILGGENLIVSIPTTVNGVEGVQLFQALDADRFLAMENFLKNAFVATDSQGRPRVGIACGSVAENLPSCTIWMWLWPEEFATDPDSRVTIVKYPVGGLQKSYLRMLITDPADARSLFDRMRIEAEPGTDGASGMTFLRKSFVASDDSMNIDCYQYYGRKNGFGCVIEASLDRVATVDAATPGLQALSEKSYELQNQKGREIAGARAAVLGVLRAERLAVEAQVEAHARAREQLREEIMNRALAAYYQSRSYSPRNRGGDGGAALLRATSPEDLLIIAEAYLNSR